MVQRLTRREIQCVRLAGEGRSNKEIARDLALSPSTVNNHLTHAYAKLGTSDRSTAAAIAASDYPDFSRFQPSPVAPSRDVVLPPTTPGSDHGDGGDTTVPSNWFLPPPPKRRSTRALAILVLAIVAAVATIGMVSVVGAGMSVFAGHAPSNAILAPENKGGEAR